MAEGQTAPMRELANVETVEGVGLPNCLSLSTFSSKAGGFEPPFRYGS